MTAATAKKVNLEKEIGELLKAQREHLNLSQREIAQRLSYKNTNFISMMESGASKIPFGKIPEITDAYQFAKEFSLILIRGLYPEAWNVMLKLKNELPHFTKKVNDDVEIELDALYTKLVKEFRIRR